MTNIAFCGLGTMGLPMTLNLLRAGHTVTVYNRTPEKCQPAIEAGAQIAHSPQAAATQAQVVMICVSDTPDVQAVILGSEGIIHSAAPGTIVIDFSTISPQATREMAAILETKSIKMLDAPLSGGSEGAIKGTLSIMVGGNGEDLAAVRPLLDCVGKTITHIGAIGTGQLTKAINQIMIAGTYWSIAEGLTLGLKAGLDLEQVVQAISGGAAGSWGLTHRSGNMIRNEYPLGFRVQLHRKDLQIALQAAQELGVSLPIAGFVAQMENGLIHRGFGDEDVSAIARLVREQAGLSGEE
jgi:3-hydroxyisobutyrate dehydrogenase